MVVRLVIPESVAARLDQLAAQVPVIAGRSAAHARAALAREALAAGLEAIEKNPARLVAPPAKGVA